ncbi:glycoside hydrolase family 2 TIM barrel-domain containing protein [Sporosarcina sp. YIM B06819]|uniref:glycoside hydrolase family 2 TIM barrel-domain containing protein n=1 Tax=Sporosarcina sp. YIM B06819 TaxID=3081769 RepID=UPI00298C07E9|nr:glycoside hydrolase family 2 TIM barrel-domain containing protein [Sporosarcina sp. YIM B06819]
MTMGAIVKGASVRSFEEEGSFVYKGERRVDFNDGWRFQREVDGRIANVPALTFNDDTWRQVNVPHDWSVELDFNPNSPATHEAGYLDGGIGWYRKTFTLPSSMKGKRISIDFDGVYMDSTTYLNGQLIGKYPFGYNAFSYDITDKLYLDGRENVLVVKVNNTQPSSRWYSGSGIYRHVYLTVTDPIHVARYGTFVTTPALKQTYALGRADVTIKTSIHNESDALQDIKVKSTIYDAASMVVSTVWSEKRSVAEGAVIDFEEYAVIEAPQLWGIDNPYRYKLVTEVVVNEEVVDTYETLFGVRYFDFDADEGFSLNGQYMKLHGVCMHHDLGALGAATNARAVERQLQIMKDMGVNSIRVTHNPASPELLEAANALGLLVVEEAFDSWNQSKKTYDYSQFFSTWAEHDVKEMVNRGKNEPSIIMWSIGNEIYDTTSESGVTIAKDLVRWIKEIDTTRPTTIGEDKTRADKVNVTPLNEHIKDIFDAVDIVGLNYSENNYLGYHEQHPEWKIYGAETSSATRSRGVYTHPYTFNQSTQYPDLQQSSYDNDYVAWGRTAEDAWKYDRDLKHIAGQFIWTGFDYIGEPTPYYNVFPAKSSYFGAVDTAGFPKDIYYYYQSQWSKEPMLHILPHWNWTVGETVRVLAYTNAHTVDLLLNGQSIGERSYVVKSTAWGSSYKETAEGATYLEWAVPFEPGVLTAIGKDEHGQVIAEDKIITAGEPAGVRLTTDQQVIRADGKDVSFITVDIVDGEGHIVPTANHLVSFTIEGNGQLAGVDNGDAASVERYKANERQAFNGKALAIVQSSKQPGTITLKASALGLTGDTVHIVTTQGDSQMIADADCEESKLVAVELVSDRAEIVEDDIIELTIQGRLENNEWIDVLTNSPIYEFDNPIIQIDNNKLYALEEGRVNITATISHKGALFTTPKWLVTIRKNPVKKSIERLEFVSLTVDEGQQPSLPTTIKAYYTVGMPRDVQVQWDDIDAEQVGKSNQFSIVGRIEGTDLTTIAEVTVRRAIAVEHITLAVLQNQLPQLPQEVTVYFSDETERKSAVKWDEVPMERLKEVGLFTVNGFVDSTHMTVNAQIRVTDEIGSEQNISRAKNGYDYPKVDASFTNKEASSNDKIEAIHDDLISYDEHPHNRWTNWQLEHRPNDWVSVTFGDYEPVDYDVDNIELHWYADQHASYPASYKIQYKSGDHWIDVANLQSNPATTAIRQANMHSFDRVKTSAIRVDMTAQAGMAIAITELKIFSKWPKLKIEPAVTTIKIDDKNILADFVGGDGNYDYYVKLQSFKEIPVITAAGEDNASTTIIPAVTLPGTAKVLVKSEDGKKMAVYAIHFSVAE